MAINCSGAGFESYGGGLASLREDVLDPCGTKLVQIATRLLAAPFLLGLVVSVPNTQWFFRFVHIRVSNLSIFRNLAIL